MLKAGDVVLIHCLSTNPPKDKFCICLCPTNKLFFFINSKQYWPKDAQIMVQPHELTFLNHDSWIDTSKVINISQSEIRNAVKDKNRHKGSLSNLIRLRIKKMIKTHRHLPEAHVDVVNKNL